MLFIKSVRKKLKLRKIKMFAVAVLTMLAVASANNRLNAQTVSTKVKSKKDQKKEWRSDASVGAHNFTWLTVDKNGGMTFNNAFNPSAELKFTNQKDLQIGVGASGCIVYKDGKWVTVNDLFLLSIAKQLPSGAELTFDMGRKTTHRKDNFGKVAPPMYVQGNYGVALGNLQNVVTVGYRTKNKRVAGELGFVAGLEDGSMLFFPNPKKSQFWAKVVADVVDTDDCNLQLSAAGAVSGKSQTVFSNMSLRVKKGWGMAVGGNWNPVARKVDGFATVSKDLKKGFKAVATVLQTNKETNLVMSVNKDGKLEIFTVIPVNTGNGVFHVGLMYHIKAK